MIKLENNKLLVKLSEGRGARVESFVDKETQKDWAWQRPGINSTISTQQMDLKAGFDDSWTGGWEEVFPNDAPTEVMGYKLVDHGELWRESWKLEDASERSATFSFNCETYPTIVKKTYSIDESNPVLTIYYEIENLSQKNLPFIFKLHPALSIEPGDRFVLPLSKMEPVALGFSRIIGQEGVTNYPSGKNIQGEEVRVDEVLPFESKSREFVRISDIERGKCSLVSNRTNRSLNFEFQKEVLPYVWQFMSSGGFMGLFVAMLEPTNAGHYDLSIAEKNRTCGFLKPREKVNFEIKISLDDL